MRSNADASAMCAAYAIVTADCMWFESNIRMNSNIANAIKSHVTDALSDALTSARKQHKLQALHADHSEHEIWQDARSWLSTMITVGICLLHLIHQTSECFT